jgi:serine/threonine protein kinase
VTDQGAGPDPTTLSSGAKIIGGAYEVERLIKAGGMGEVYRGRNVQTGRNVAIKIILASLARNETYMALFEREALILEELAHEAIVRYQLYAVDQTTGRPCLVMQFVPGPSLKERMEQGPMTAGDIRLLTKRLASGLAAAHNHDYKVYHRDLSPDNVILEDGRVEKAKLIDFGIAKGGAQSAEKSMLAGQIAGKFSYMAPEQLGLFGDEIDARTDIYSLGLIILGLFRGKAVDMGKNIGEAVMRRQSVPDISAVSPELQPLLHSMLSPQPADRPLNMEAVLRLLDEAKPVLPRPIEAFDAGPTVLTPRPEVLPGPESVPPAEPTPPLVAAAISAAVSPSVPVEVTPPPAREPTPPPVIPPPVTPLPEAEAFDLEATVIKRPPVKAPVSAPAAPVQAEPDPAEDSAEDSDGRTVVGLQKPQSAPQSGPPARAEKAVTEPVSAPVSAPVSPAPEPLGLGDLDDLLPPAKPASPQKTAPQKSETQKSGALVPLLALGVVAVLGGGGAYMFLGGPPTQSELTQTEPTQTAASEPVKAPEPAQPEPAPAPEVVPEPVAPEPAPEPTQPEPAPEPTPSPAEIRTAVLSQLTPLRESLLGSCSFLRLEGADTALVLQGVGANAQAALDGITPPQGASLTRQAQGFAPNDAFCGAVELANLRDAPGATAPVQMEVTGLEVTGQQGETLKSGSEMAIRLAGADAHARLYLIGAETGRITPLPLSEGRATLRLEVSGDPASEMLLALSPGVALPELEALVDGHSADGALRLIAHALQKAGAEASIDLLPFTVE